MNVPLVDLRAAFAPVKEQVFREFEAILDGMQLFHGPEHGGVRGGVRRLLRRRPRPRPLERHRRAVRRAARVRRRPGRRGDRARPHLLRHDRGDRAHGRRRPCSPTSSATRSRSTRPPRARSSPTARARSCPCTCTARPPTWIRCSSSRASAACAWWRTRRRRTARMYKGRRAGSLGDAASFSFYFTKNLGGVGEGGFVTTSDAAIAEQVRLLRHHGHVSKFEHAIIGYNLRLDELQAAVLRAKLPGLDAGNAQRRAHAAHYERAVRGIGGAGARVPARQRARLPRVRAARAAPRRARGAPRRARRRHGHPLQEPGPPPARAAPPPAPRGRHEGDDRGVPRADLAADVSAAHRGAGRVRGAQVLEFVAAG